MVAKQRKFQQRITISLTERDQERLGRLATLDDVSISQVVRRAIREFLDRQIQHELALDVSASDRASRKTSA